MSLIQFLFFAAVMVFGYIFFNSDTIDWVKIEGLIEFSKQFYIVAVPAMMIWEYAFFKSKYEPGWMSLISIFVVALIMVTLMVLVGIGINLIFDNDVPDLIW